MKFTSCCATLVILCMTIGCGTQTETHSIDTFPVSESENMPVSESENMPVADRRKPDVDLGNGPAKNALNSALANAKADSKNLLVHFGSPG